MSVSSMAYWGFPIDAALHKQARNTIGEIRDKGQTRDTRLNEKAASVVMELTDHGLHHYYGRPTEIVPLHPVAKKTADAGVNTVLAALKMVIKQFFKKRDPQELLAVSAYLEEMLWQHPNNGRHYLVFMIEDDLFQRAQYLIGQVRQGDHPSQYIDGVIDALGDLVSHSVNYYYHQPTQRVNMEGFSKKTADVGIKSAEKGIRRLIDKLLRELSSKQLVELSYHLESMIHAREMLADIDGATTH